MLRDSETWSNKPAAGNAGFAPQLAIGRRRRGVAEPGHSAHSITGIMTSYEHSDQNRAFDLNRFLSAQEDTFDVALSELRRGRKESHCMWFIFPQIYGLGNSPTSRKYAIRSQDEARAYLNHPVLGPRLIDCCSSVGGIGIAE